MPELLLVAIGIALRLRQFLADRSLWLDEAMLGNAVVSRSLSDLVRIPLPDDQAAPPGFLALLRTSVVALGPTEQALRLVPLVAGVAAVVLAWRVGARLLPGRAARCCLVGLVALSPTLVYFSGEAKQYGVDAAVTLLLLYLALGTGGRWRLATAGALVPWISHPAVLLLPGVGIVRALAGLRHEGRRAVAPYAGVATVWAASVALLVALTRVAVGGNQNLAQFWQAAYAPFPIRSGADVAWYARLWADLIGMALQNAGSAGPAPDLWWPAWLDVVLPVLLLAGIAGLARHAPGRRALLVVACTIGTALAAAAAHQYPLASRLIVFAVPLVFLLLAGAVDGLAAVRGVGPLLAAGTAAALVALTIPPALAVWTHPPERADAKGALAYVAAHRRPGDQLGPTGWSAPAVAFYRARFALDGMPQAPSIPPLMDAPAYVERLRAGGMLAPTWIVVCHRFEERERFLHAARALAPQLDAWEGEGAGAYLLDFAHLR